MDLAGAQGPIQLHGHAGCLLCHEEDEAPVLDQAVRGIHAMAPGAAFYTASDERRFLFVEQGRGTRALGARCRGGDQLMRSAAGGTMHARASAPGDGATAAVLVVVVSSRRTSSDVLRVESLSMPGGLRGRDRELRGEM